MLAAASKWPEVLKGCEVIRGNGWSVGKGGWLHQAAGRSAISASNQKERRAPFCLASSGGRRRPSQSAHSLHQICEPPTDHDMPGNLRASVIRTRHTHCKTDAEKDQDNSANEYNLISSQGYTVAATQHPTLATVELSAPTADGVCTSFPSSLHPSTSAAPILISAQAARTNLTCPLRRRTKPRPCLVGRKA